MKTGLVVKVYDGDTIRLEGGPRIRYARVNTPEVGQPNHGAAMKLNRELVLNKYVTYKSQAADVFGRLVCEVWLPDGRNVNDIMIEHGYKG